MLLEVVLLTLVASTLSNPLSYPWTEDRANIIRDKLLFMWQNIEPTSKDFDERYTGPYKGYLWDPNRATYERNCNAEKSLCKQWYDEIGDRYNGRLNRNGFTPSKALRLAFHDCIPYKDGSKGCDGCLNMEVDGDLFDNEGLQFPIAVLVSSTYSAYSNCSTGSNKRTGWQYFQVKLAYQEENTRISVPVRIFHMNFLIVNSNHVVCK